MIVRMRLGLEAMERGFAEWASTHGVAILRISLGIIFVWFGVLKLCPGLCDVEVLAGRTMQTLTWGLVPVKICIRMLALAECGIGAGLMFSPTGGQWMRLTTMCLMLHLAGTFLPLVMFPGETWKHFPYAPTLVGQYILKNLVLMSAAVVVGARAFGRERVLGVVPIRPRRVAAGAWGEVAGIS